MTRKLEVSPERCTGCQSCMLACSFVKEGAHALSRARIRIERDEAAADFRPRVCIQCAERSCVAACPVGALAVHAATGAVLVDSAACVGCGACVSACPVGGVGFDDDAQRPLFCDLCGGSPECVATCRFPQAIRFSQEVAA
jgi:Fe-S-cluster-containing hydrogenase component 2